MNREEQTAGDGEASGAEPAQSEMSSADYRVCRKNAVIYVVRNVLWRFGWLFKNEGLVVSSFVKALGVNNTVLSLLPLLNRLGRALPQMAVAAILRRIRCKKQVAAASVGLFGLLWLVLGALVYHYADVWPNRLMLVIMLALYFPSMMALASAILAGQMLRGKLVPVTWRGRVQGTGAVIGAPLGVVVTLLVLKPILSGVHGELGVYGIFFMIAGGMFLFLSFLTMAFVEHEDAQPCREDSAFREALHAFRSDPNFRKMMIIRAGTYIIFGGLPFYTSYGYEVAKSVGVDWKELIALCLITLEVGKLLGVAAMGWFADRIGNRQAMAFSLLMGTFWPACALWTGWLVAAGLAGPKIYLAAYVMQGLTMPMFFISTNYLLEAAPEDKRPAYMASGNMVMLAALPVLPVLGVVADIWGLELTLAILGVVAGGLTLLALRMDEPRGKLAIPAQPLAP